MSDQKVQIIITTDASGTITGLNQVRDGMSKMESHSQGVVSKVKEQWLGITAAVAAVGFAVSKAAEYMKQGAQAMQQESSFKIVAEQSGANAETMIANMKRMTKETVDDSDLMQKATKLMLAGYDPAQIERLSAVAITASQVAGTSVAEAFDGMADAIANKTPKALVQLGAVTREQMKVVTAAVEAGASSMSLYELAMANLELKQLKLKGTIDEATLSMQRFSAQAKETEETIGKGLFIGLQKLSAVLQGAAGDFLYLYGGLMKFYGGMAELESKFSTGDHSKQMAQLANSYKIDAEAAFAASEDLHKKAKDNILGTAEVGKKATATELAEGQAKVDFQMRLMELIKEQGKQGEEFLKKWQKTKETIGLSGYAKDSALLKVEYDGYNKIVTDKVALDQWYAYGKSDLLRKESLRIAEEDKKSLETQLKGSETYYASLQAMIEKNNEAEKKSLAELMALRQQRVNIEKSTTDLIAKIKGTDKSMSAQQQYETGRSSLNQQFMDATNNNTGQDQIKALEAYKQAVAALQQQFSSGIPGPKDIFGKPGEIVSSAKIAEDAISDIERATQMEKSSIAVLAEEKQKQIEAEKLWGQTLSEEAEKAKGSIDNIKTAMTNLSDQILNMQKTITLTGVDEVSKVVDNIADRIQKLHDLAAKPIVISTVMSGGNLGSTGGSMGSGNTPLYGTGWDSAAPAPVMDSFAIGTPYVPRTGIYQLHRGEAVVPAEQNKAGKAGITITGGINIQIPANAAPQRPEDWRSITRDYIVPELRKMNA